MHPALTDDQHVRLETGKTTSAGNRELAKKLSKNDCLGLNYGRGSASAVPGSAVPLWESAFR